MHKIALLFTLLFSWLTADERYAFIYSKNIDDRFVNFYDKVVVEADAIDNIYAIRHPEKMVAYVSVGEIEPWRKTATPYDPSWIISENKTWNSLIADLRKKAYQNFILERVAKLHKMGYRNFFLDTMDAYHVTAKDKVLFQKQQKSLIAFIHRLHKKYPKSKLIINRGFELLDKIHKDVDAVVAESLVKRYDHANKAYVDVPLEDREWLLANFKKAKNLGLDAVSIEYTDKDTKERLKIAKRVKALGMIPYVTDGLLQEQGECEIERIRREVLILFNQSVFKDKNSVYSDVHLLTSMPLEYFGYVPTLYDISTKELPKSVQDKYHAVIVWSSGATKNDEKLYDWVKQLKSQNIKVLFFDNFTFNLTPKRLEELKLITQENNNTLLEKAKATYHKPYEHYEIPASIEFQERLINPMEGQPIVSLNYENGQKSTPIAITSWGGYALNGSFLHNIGDENFWTIDPFKFLKDTLRLDNIPVPDPTTEAGRRILFVHVDGDGFMEIVRVDKEMLSAEYLIENIYKKYPIPQTLSLIQGEVDTIGLYPKLSPRMKEIAKELYQIPWVEPASHTLSHPFYWHKASKANNKLTKAYHLKIPNYYFSLERETKGSVEFALSLAPKSKQKEKVLFWTGDCLPTKEILAYIEREGILAMNGGDTTIKKSDPWLSHIAPFGLQHDEYWQIYTAQQNENVFTNDWTGPFWGYRDAIETFEMTEEPRRLKPINIYYHFYSGSKLAAANALEEVYSWAVKQKTSKLYASQYIKKAKDFYETSLAKIEGGYEVRNSGYLRTVRFDSPTHINIKSSQGVAGYNHHKEHTYVTLDQQKNQQIILTQNQSNTPYLIDSNGWVESVSKNHNHYTFKLNANMGLEATFHLPKTCRSLVSNTFTQKQNREQLSISSQENKGATVVFKCQ
ncbi:MAG: endo alpha-1,4 polygalactosaminidase [Epsilonproteobacteria bacterium]|nr:endo alpha-1,4 polygalactosaminidase [Campylobacterota bacterium]